MEQINLNEKTELKEQMELKEDKGVIEYPSLEEIRPRFNIKSSYCAIKVKKEDTQKMLKTLKDHCIKIKNVNPVNHINETENLVLTKHLEKDKSILEEFLKSQNLTFPYEQQIKEIQLNYDNFTYAEVLKMISPSDDIPNSYEVIGKIAHLNLREKFLPMKYLIGKLIIDKNSGIKTVINKTSKIDNVFRTYEMEVLAGEPEFDVTHREGSLSFVFDIRKVYWCSRLQAERDRVIKMFKKGEVLCDAFCGVGPLAIRAAKSGIKVIANDLNPFCYEYLNINIKKNKIDKEMIKTFNMDAREFIKSVIGQSKNIKDEDENFDGLIPSDIKIDHFYMNLPKDALEFLDVFVGLFNNTKKEIYNKNSLPMVHVYGFSNSRDPQADLFSRIAAAFEIKSFDSSYVTDFHNVRDVSNNKHMFCISFKIPAEVAYK